MARRSHVPLISAFTTLLLLTTMVSLELAATAVFHLSEVWPDQASIQKSLQDPSAPEASIEGTDNHRKSNVLHPYIGYVRDPLRFPSHMKRAIPGASVNDFGFLGPSPLWAKDPDVARVAITGGSVAEELFVYGGELLARDLEATGAFDGRSVELVSLAMAGFKQPQQLIAVSYALLLGAEIDAVVNIDGFNEVVLPVTGLVPLDVTPSYPFRWNALATDTIGGETALAVARIEASSMKLEAWRGFFSAFPLPHSAFALASWHVMKTRLDHESVRLEMELREKLGTSLQSRPSLRGPRAQFESEDALFEHSVDIWSRASIQLSQLCRSQGVAYLHVLQPNQYVADSKPFTPSERKIAILASHQLTRRAAEAGYTRMIEAGAGLVEMGHPFVDITDVFENVKERIYRDHCCHYHKRGYAIVASRIALELGQLSH